MLYYGVEAVETINDVNRSELLEELRLVRIIENQFGADPYDEDEWDRIWAPGEDDISIEDRDWLYARLFGNKG